MKIAIFGSEFSHSGIHDFKVCELEDTEMVYQGKRYGIPVDGKTKPFYPICEAFDVDENSDTFKNFINAFGGIKKPLEKFKFVELKD